MKSNSMQHNRRSKEGKTVADEILGKLYAQARACFREVIKSFWLYESDLCPGCLTRPVCVIKMKGEDALALNAFIYRPRGVLIWYFLGETCAKFIFKEAQKDPYKETPLHADIERNLIAAYHRHVMSLDT